MHIIKSSLSERLLLYDVDEEPQKYGVTGGVPQDSALEPISSNVL